MELKETLKSLGLTDSESKVYLALLKLGISSKTAIIKEAKIAPSKLYNILDKLADKGLVSMIIKDNVKNYSAANPSKIKEYLETKKEEIEKQQENLNSLLKKFENLQKEKINETKAEIYFGWKGMETVYSRIISELKEGQEAFVLGASAGTNKEKTKEFFIKYGIHSTIRKKANVKIIFDENSRDYVKEAEKESGIKYNKRFLQKSSPVEIAFTLGYTAIVILKEEPIIIVIQDKETSKSFIEYFNELWNIAKK
jgi:sugar-specific transcriptional regulator TrmB